MNTIQDESISILNSKEWLEFSRSALEGVVPELRDSTLIEISPEQRESFLDLIGWTKSFSTEIYTTNNIPQKLSEELLDLYHASFEEPPFSWRWDRGNFESKEPGTAAAFFSAYMTSSSQFVVNYDKSADLPKLVSFGIIMTLDEEYAPDRAGVAEFGGKIGDKYLAVICVKPDYRGHSLFNQQIDERLGLCSSEDVVWLRTHAEKEQVQAVYKAIGFEKAGTFTRDIFGGTTVFVALKRDAIWHDD